MNNVLKQYFIIQKLKDAFFTTDFLTLCEKMSKDAFFLVRPHVLKYSHFFTFNKKEVRGTAREDQDLVFSQFFKTRNYHTEVKLVR